MNKLYKFVLVLEVFSLDFFKIQTSIKHDLCNNFCCRMSITQYILLENNEKMFFLFASVGFGEDQ